MTETFSAIVPNPHQAHLTLSKKAMSVKMVDAFPGHGLKGVESCLKKKWRKNIFVRLEVKAKNSVSFSTPFPKQTFFTLQNGNGELSDGGRNKATF